MTVTTYNFIYIYPRLYISAPIRPALKISPTPATVEAQFMLDSIGN